MTAVALAEIANLAAARNVSTRYNVSLNSTPKNLLISYIFQWLKKWHGLCFKQGHLKEGPLLRMLS